MNKHHLLPLVMGVFTLITPSVSAQNPAPSLQDLVGVRGSSGEMQLRRRGYQFLKTEKTGNSAYSYWREQSTGNLTVKPMLRVRVLLLLKQVGEISRLAFPVAVIVVLMVEE